MTRDASGFTHLFDVPTGGGLLEFSDLHRQVLIFEATWRPSTTGESRRTAVHDRFGLTFHRYQRVLAQACEHPEAKKIAPSVVRRLTGAPQPRLSA